MKKIIVILAILMTLFTLSSCVTAAQAQVDAVYDVYDDDVDINVVVTYGTPYYNTSGLLMYYVYRDMFYYPYYYNNRYYLHRYHRPLPFNRMERYRPVPRDFYKYNRPHTRPHDGGRHHHHVTPQNNHRYHVTPNGHNNHPRPNGGIRPNGGMRPNINRGGSSMRPQMPRSSTRITANGHGHHGGRR